MIGPWSNGSAFDSKRKYKRKPVDASWEGFSPPMALNTNIPSCSFSPSNFALVALSPQGKFTPFRPTIATSLDSPSEGLDNCIFL